MNLQKTVLNKEEESSSKLNLNDIGLGDILKIILKRLVNYADYNKAENILFEAINKENSQETYLIAIDFYNLLLGKSDEELKEANFTREEIYQGLQDIKNIYGK